MHLLYIYRLRGGAKKYMLQKLFSKTEGQLVTPEDYVEVDVTDAASVAGLGKVGIKIDKLADFSDTERILRELRDGSVIFLKIKTLREKDMGELKRSIERLKRTVLAQNGDIVGIEQDWLILTPEFAVVHK